MRRMTRAAILTLMAYLLQVCVMPYCKIAGVMPNLLAVNIAVLTVSLGRKYTFIASCVTGILLEAMTASVGAMFVILYPALGMLLAQVFADMSDQKREMRRSRNRDARDMNPHIRIPLYAMSLCAAIEAVLLAYTTLSGAELTLLHIARLLIAVLYTGALAALLMAPLRAYLRMYGGRVKRAMTEVNENE